MFCKKCGTQIQDEWKVCPNCGNLLKSDKNSIEIANSRYTGNAQKKMKMTREEIKEILNSKIFSKEGGVVLWYGSGAISRDLEQILNPGEEIECFYFAYRNSLSGHIKSANVRMFREYIVCTDQRVVYYETGRTTLSLVPLLKKEISISYEDIREVQAEKVKGIYSGRVSIEGKNKYNFVMKNYEDTMGLKAYIENKQYAG